MGETCSNSGTDYYVSAMAFQLDCVFYDWVETSKEKETRVFKQNNRQQKTTANRVQNLSEAMIFYIRKGRRVNKIFHISKMTGPKKQKTTPN